MDRKLTNESGNLDPDQVDEIDRIELNFVGKTIRSDDSSRPIVKNSLLEDISALRTKTNKLNGYSHRLSKEIYQMQIDSCISNLQEHFEILMQLYDIFITQSPSSKINQSNEKSTEIEPTKFSEFIETYEMMFEALKGLDDNHCNGNKTNMGKYQIISSFESAFSSLDLKSYSGSAPFNRIKIGKIQRLINAVLRLRNVADRHLEKIKVSETYGGPEASQNVKEDLLVNYTSFCQNSSTSLEVIIAVIRLSNVCKNFDRDIGTLLSIQGLNPFTFEDERNKEDETTPGEIDQEPKNNEEERGMIDFAE